MLGGPAQERIAKLLSEGETPLEFLLKVMRTPAKEKANDESERDYLYRVAQVNERRTDAAKAAAPYCHPKLAQVEHSGSITQLHEDSLSELE